VFGKGRAREGKRERMDRLLRRREGREESSGVLLKMEVGIRKRAWQRA